MTYNYAVGIIVDDYQDYVTNIIELLILFTT